MYDHDHQPFLSLDDEILFNRYSHSAEPTPKIRASVHWLFCCFVALSLAVCRDCLSYGFLGTRVST